MNLITDSKVYLIGYYLEIYKPSEKLKMNIYNLK